MLWLHWWWSGAGQRGCSKSCLGTVTGYRLTRKSQRDRQRRLTCLLLSCRPSTVTPNIYTLFMNKNASTAMLLTFPWWTVTYCSDHLYRLQLKQKFQQEEKRESFVSLMPREQISVTFSYCKRLQIQTSVPWLWPEAPENRWISWWEQISPIEEPICDRTSAAVTEVLDLGWVVHEFWIDQNEDQCILFMRCWLYSSCENVIQRKKCSFISACQNSFCKEESLVKSLEA